MGRLSVRIACGALLLALATAPVAAASDASLCRVARAQHAEFFEHQKAFTEAFSGGDTVRAAQLSAFLSGDIVEFRQRVRAQRASTARGQRMRTAIFRMLDGWRGGVRSFDEAINRTETGAAGAADTFMEGLRRIAEATAAASGTLARANCRLPRPPA